MPSVPSRAVGCAMLRHAAPSPRCGVQSCEPRSASEAAGVQRRGTVHGTVTKHRGNLRGAVCDEQKRRQNEQQRITERFQDQCREAKGQPKISQYTVEEPEKAASFTVLDGLKGCEAALTAMDRLVQDKLYDIVRSDVNKHAAVQQGHLQEMEQKVDKLVHTLHTPSGHDSAAFAAPGPLGSRDAWREQFRNALKLGSALTNDSSYVKRALKTSRV
eukprot:Skav217775  [mRNA]  locus=scaffold1782:37151:48187:- [translate_table: standard]